MFTVCEQMLAPSKQKIAGFNLLITLLYQMNTWRNLLFKPCEQMFAIFKHLFTLCNHMLIDRNQMFTAYHQTIAMLHLTIAGSNPDFQNFKER